MFDFAWSEIAVIGVVALIAIGPKDMPAAIRAVTTAIKKARRMAGEFQTHVDEMVREANLDEVRKEFNQIRNFDFKGTVERTVDPDHTLRDAFKDPIAAHPPQPAGVMSDPPPWSEIKAVEAHDTTILATPPDDDPVYAPAAHPDELAPPFIPPAAAVAEPERPAFVPPGAARQADRSLRF